MNDTREVVVLMFTGSSSDDGDAEEGGNEEEEKEEKEVVNEEMDVSSRSSSSHDGSQGVLEHSENEGDVNNDRDDPWEEGQGDLNAEPGSSGSCMAGEAMTPAKVWVSTAYLYYYSSPVSKNLS